MTEGFRPIPETEALVKYHGGAMQRKPDRGRTIYAQLIENESKPARKTSLIEYHMLPLDVWAGQAQEAHSSLLWELLVLLFIEGVTAIADETGEACGSPGSLKNWLKSTAGENP